MMKIATTTSHSATLALRHLMAIGVLLSFLIGNLGAQTFNPTNGSTPMALAPGAPAGAFALTA